MSLKTSCLILLLFGSAAVEAQVKSASNQLVLTLPEKYSPTYVLEKSSQQVAAPAKAQAPLLPPAQVVKPLVQAPQVLDPMAYCLDSFEKRVPLLEALVPVIKGGLRVGWMYNSEQYMTDGVFYTSWDWHSSVHAHWALLTLGQHLQDRNLTYEIVGRFSAKALMKEREWLNHKLNRHYDLYGQAWLLLLISELEKFIPVERLNPKVDENGKLIPIDYNLYAGHQLRQLKYETLNRVSEHLMSSRFPDTGRNECSGAHSGWTFKYLLFSLSNPPKEYNKIISSLHQKFLQAPACLDDDSSNTKNTDVTSPFVQIGSMMDLLNKPSGYEKVEGAPSLISVDRLRDLTGGSGHYALKAISSHWRLAAHEGIQPKERNQCRKLDRFFGSMLSQRNVWSPAFHGGSVDMVAHVAPQFIWLPMWLDQEIYANPLRESSKNFVWPRPPPPPPAQEDNAKVGSPNQ